MSANWPREFAKKQLETSSGHMPGFQVAASMACAERAAKCQNAWLAGCG